MGQGKEEIPESYIGPKANGLAALLKYNIKVPQRRIQELFQKFFALTFVPSSVPGFHNQIRNKGRNLYDPLKEEIKKSRSFTVMKQVVLWSERIGGIGSLRVPGFVCMAFKKDVGRLKWKTF